MTAATSPASPASRHLAIEDLDRAIVDLSARINAATSELLALIREFDERAGFLKWGFASCTAWLALTRVANEENEAALIAFALTTTAARVDERCRQMRNVQPDSGAQAHRIYQQRALRVWRDAGRGTLTLTVELPLEQGELICRALDKAVEDCAGNGAEDADTSWPLSRRMRS
jgi:hypothetical protein